MSKFKGLLESTRQGTQEQPEEQHEHTPTTASKAPAPELRRRGRPKGKRSDPNYEQITAYIRKDTYTSVKISLLQEGGDRDFSDLVEDLLASWVRSRT